MSRPPHIKGGGTGLAITAFGCGLFTICAASLPYFMTRNVKPLQSREEVRNIVLTIDWLKNFFKI